MALGDITVSQQTKSMVLLAPTTATNGTPIGLGTTVGVSVGELLKGAAPPESVVHIWSSAGSGTMSCSARLWGYSGVSGFWSPLGPDATAASRGLMNVASSIDEVGSDVLRHMEPVYCVWALDRLYLEITAISGTSTAVNAVLIVPAMIAA